MFDYSTTDRTIKGSSKVSKLKATLKDATESFVEEQAE
jgi:hypothetical protein